MSKIAGFKDLIVYQKAYKLAMEIFEITKSFPKEDKYIIKETHERLSNGYDEVRKMLIAMINNPEKWCNQ